MPKRQPPSFTVVADSNALFPKDVTKLVSPKFMTIWEECSALATLRLILPEIVKGERLYQLVTAAEKATQNAVKNFDTIAKVTGKNAPTLPTREELIADVERRFADWASENRITIAPPPIDKIDWKRVINDSVWRIPPFVPAGEEEDSEKGFRDCLILETLRDIIQGGPGVQYVFISKDSLLRTAAVAQCDPKSLTTYEDVAGFASYLKLINEQLNQEFVRSVMQKVSSVFFSPNDPDCVYFKCEVEPAIKNEFGLSLSLFSGTTKTLFSDLIAELPGLPTGLHQPVSDERVFIDTTEFESLTPPDTYHWRTHLRFVRLFRQTNLNPILLSMGLSDKIRIAKFDVLWKATLDESETFSNVAVTDIRLTGQLSETGWHNRRKYGFEVDEASTTGV